MSKREAIEAIDIPNAAANETRAAELPVMQVRIVLRRIAVQANAANEAREGAVNARKKEANGLHAVPVAANPGMNHLAVNESPAANLIREAAVVIAPKQLRVDRTEITIESIGMRIDRFENPLQLKASVQELLTTSTTIWTCCQ